MRRLTGDRRDIRGNLVGRWRRLRRAPFQELPNDVDELLAVRCAEAEDPGELCDVAGGRGSLAHSESVLKVNADQLHQRRLAAIGADAAEVELDRRRPPLPPRPFERRG